MRRAALIWSNDYLRDFAIQEMMKAFMECGYKESSLVEAMNRVQQLNRADLLQEKIDLQPTSDDSPLLFVLPFSVDTAAIKQHINRFNDDLQLLTGTSSVIFSCKRNSNTASLLFNKFGFAQLNRSFASQMCGATNCLSCILKKPDLSWIDILPNFTLKPSKSLNCKSDCVIYCAICKLCRDFYFGKTMNADHVRMNGHRDKFHIDKYDKSALAMHIFVDHPDAIGDSPAEGLANYEVILVESTNAVNLRRREDYYIWITQADIRHLNRYKVSR